MIRQIRKNVTRRWLNDKKTTRKERVEWLTKKAKSLYRHTLHVQMLNEHKRRKRREQNRLSHRN